VSDLNVQPGGADGFYDVGFGDEAYTDAGIEREDMSTISVHVCPDTGEVSLNAGYEAGSALGKAESKLFDGHREQIHAGLVDLLSRDPHPDAEAFLAKAGSSGPRP
jgi:hypothetical protein